MRVLPETKTLNYLVSVQKQKELARAGVLELLYVFDGAVLECSSSNVFIVKNQVLITPKSDILPGTTKMLVLKLAKGKYKVDERRVSVKELKTADEVFITASNKAVMPVVKIDSYKIGNGKPGPVSLHLQKLFEKKVSTV
jgi:branched-subunit amino acid aminotransferase/4-amino-4-deoxychorismate lyase